MDGSPGRISIFNFKFTFPTLEEVLKMVIDFNKEHQGARNPDGRLGGILIEAKDSQMYRDLYGIEIGETILEKLRKYEVDTIDKAARSAPIYLHSFDYGTVKYWAKHTQLPVDFLIEGDAKFNLTDINLYATGIGFEDQILWDYETDRPTSVLSEARELGLMVHIWTFKDDVLLFDSGDNLVSIH